MPSAMNALPTLRTVAFRPRPATLRHSNAAALRPACRSFADSSKDLPAAADQGAKGPNMAQQEHVSEEAAKMAKIQGGSGPDIEGQGTPVQDILKEEKQTRENAPKVMQENIKKGGTTKPQTRPFSTYARRRMDLASSSAATTPTYDPTLNVSASEQAAFAAEADASSNLPEPAEDPGHKFPLPNLPLPRELVKNLRYDPVVTQVTNLLMKDGKKSVAQRNMQVVLNILRTSPAPTFSPTRPLLPGAPPASHLPLNPTMYLTLAIDSVAPLLRIRSQKGAAGGGVALQIPVPLGLRQRRRTAFMWILEAAVKRKSRGSGNDMFAQKVADEVIAVVEGRSSIWDKRTAVHKLATTARANLNYMARRR